MVFSSAPLGGRGILLPLKSFLGVSFLGVSFLGVSFLGVSFLGVSFLVVSFLSFDLVPSSIPFSVNRTTLAILYSPLVVGSICMSAINVFLPSGIYNT